MPRPPRSSRALILVAITSAWLHGCAAPAVAGPKPVARPAAAPPPFEVRLAEQRHLQVELNDAVQRHLAAHAAWEKKRADYLVAVSTELLTVRGARKESRKAIVEMTSERTQVAKELASALKALGEALLARARASGDLLTVETRLWEQEAEAYGGRAAAAAKADAEIRELHDASTALHVAQKAQQGALASLISTEFELNASVGGDAEQRDIADRRLSALRSDLEARYVTLVEAARRCEDVSARLHRKLLDGLPPTKKAAAERLSALSTDREHSATDVSGARGRLKDAVMRRAEQRSQEIAHDAEINKLLAGAFKDDAARDEFLALVRGPRDVSAETLVAAQKAETELAEVRRRLATVEADITGLGY